MHKLDNQQNVAFLLEVTEIINIKNSEENKKRIFSREELIFCYKFLKRTLDAIQNYAYTEFDALTTTNCCHGLSLLVRALLIEAHDYKLQEFSEEINEKLFILEGSDLSNFYFKSYVPQCLVHLTRLYILKHVKEEDPQRGGWKTDFLKIKEVCFVGTKFVKRIISLFQTYYSNFVAEKYQDYFSQLDESKKICDVRLELWGKYIKHSYLREDKRGRKYASCLYSMQISLAYLSKIKAKIALVNDLRNHLGEVTGRYIQLYEGDGISSFVALSQESFEKSNNNEPCIVFGGCNYSDITEEILEIKIKPWIKKVENLILACDTFYPQFPRVGDDVNFDSSPIDPIENEIKIAIAKHSEVIGVSLKDSSLFCLSHVYTACLSQVVSTKNKRELKNYLPFSFLSEFAQSTNMVEFL